MYFIFLREWAGFGKPGAGGGSVGGFGCAECALEGGLWDGLRSGVREGFEDCLGAVRAVGEEDGEGGLEGVGAVVWFAGVAVDAVEECGDVEEFVAGLDELEVDELLLGGHAPIIAGLGPGATGKSVQRMRLACGGRDGVSCGVFATYVHDLDPVLLPLFGKLALRWYGLAYLAGFVVGFLLLRNLAKRKLWVLKPEQAGDFIAAAAMFGVFLGGRLGYILMYRIPEAGWGTLVEDPLQVLRVWDGGMASHGGILGLVIFTWFYAKKHKTTWTGLGDGLCVVAPVGLFFGRVANFINGELYGRVANGVAWAMKFPLSLAQQPEEVQRQAWDACIGVEPRLAEARSLEDLIVASRQNDEVLGTLAEYLPARHPSQLYEAALEGVALFAILWLVRTRCPKAPDGLLTGLFFAIYALGRIVAEQFREPDAALVGALSKGQFFSLFMFLFAGAFFVHAWRRWKQGRKGPGGVTA